MAEIKPKIVDGVAFWNVDPKNKKAFNELFEEKITELFNKETKAKRKIEGPDATLSKKEISALRNHRELGVWVIDGEPASVTNLNDFFREGSKTNTLSLNVPKRKNKYFTRKYLNSKEHRDTVLKPWFKRLNKAGWPKGRSEKGFINYLNRAYDQTVEYNKILQKRLGFDFDAGHFWGAMGPEGDRTIIGPYGAISEGKFTFRNVTSQPRIPSMEQLLNPQWNAITPNVPGFFDKRNVQVSGAQELLDVGAGGQGYQGSLVDYLLEGTEDLDKLDAWDKAYIAFGDPEKGAGATAEVRMAELFEPGGKDRVLKRLGHYTATAEQYMPRNADGELLNPVRVIKPGTEENWRLSSQGDLFAFDGSAGTMAIDRPGLLSQAWRKAINFDQGITSLTDFTSDIKNNLGLWTLQGGPNKLATNLIKDQAWNIPLTYAFSDRFRKNVSEGNWGKVGTELAVDEAIGRTTAELGKAVYSAAPQTTTAAAGLLAGAVAGVVQTEGDKKMRESFPLWTGAIFTNSGFGGVPAGFYPGFNP